MKHKHTPKPWRMHEEKDPKYKTHTFFKIDSGTRKSMLTAEAWQFSDDLKVADEVRANFRLAVASPEMLDCLEEAEKVHAKLLRALTKVPGSEDLQKTLLAIQDRRRAAITKALKGMVP